MKNFQKNIPDKLNHTQRPKTQSTGIRIKKPTSLNFEFKSSLFTEKNKYLIEKLVSQSISPDSSFSKEEHANKIKDKIKYRINKASSMIKSKMPKSVNNSILSDEKAIIKNNKKNCKKNILINKTNSTITIHNNHAKPLIPNCKKTLNKKCIKISTKPSINLPKLVKTGKSTIEKKKIVFNGIAENKNKNKITTRNSCIKQKSKSNLNSSVKTIYERKNLGNEIKNKTKRYKNLRNSVDNINNNLNIITVNTIHLKNRENIITNRNMKDKYKKKSGLFASPKYRNTIQYK